MRELIDWMKKAGPAFLTQTMRQRGKDELTPQPQDDSKATYFGKIEKEDGQVDPYNDSLEDIYATYR